VVTTTVGTETLARAGRSDGDLDEVQFVLGEGPTIDALATAQPVLTADITATGDRWLQFAQEARSRDVVGAHAIPLQLGGIRLGVLTAYVGAEVPPDPRRTAGLLRLADVVRDVIRPGPATPRERARTLAEDAPLRSSVYQAQGMVMAAQGIDLAEALTLLRAAAFSEGISINQLADELVTGRRPMLDGDR
jgi:hypothetical protein